MPQQNHQHLRWKRYPAAAVEQVEGVVVHKKVVNPYPLNPQSLVPGTQACMVRLSVQAGVVQVQEEEVVVSGLEQEVETNNALIVP